MNPLENTLKSDTENMANRTPSPENQSPNSGGGQRPSGSGLRLIFYIFLAIIISQLIFNMFQPSPEEITWTKFKRDLLAERVIDKIVVVNKEEAEVYIQKSKLGQGQFSEIDSTTRGPHYTFNIGSLENFEQTLEQSQEEVPQAERIDVSYVQRIDWWSTLLSWGIPILLIIGIWIFIMNRVQRSGGMGGAGGIFDFGKATNALKKEKSEVTFDDVAGLKEVKVEVNEVVDFLKSPDKYTRLGAKIPKGVILIGPPGTGKTLLAKAVAGEADVPFYSMSGSEFVEMFVGVGASRVRDLFKKAKQSAPSIIFIDEIDAIGQTRGKGQASFQRNDERENTLNQLLAEMDGFSTNSGIIVLAATNRGEMLDRALMRPGRFDRQIYIELPTRTERKAIFEVHVKPLKLSEDIDLDTLAAQTPGFSGADIANICNEAALIAARRDEKSISMKHFYNAIDRIVAGLERSSKIISEKEKKIIAYHEAGHAAVSWRLPNADTLLKVSIVPRGKSLGAAWYLPKENQLQTKAEFMDKICAALGGRASEDVVFNEVSSGALNDLERITKQAYMMVSYYGLDEELGNISYYDSTGEYQQSLQKPYSEETAKKIDERVHKLVESAYEKTKQILEDNRAELDQLAELLLEKEVVYKKDLKEIFGEPAGESEDVEEIPEEEESEATSN